MRSYVTLLKKFLIQKCHLSSKVEMSPLVWQPLGDITVLRITEIYLTFRVNEVLRYNIGAIAD